MSQAAIHDELLALEYRIDALLQLCQRLQTENLALREQQDSLAEERSRLIEKNNLARLKVEQMIERLKVLEEHQ